MSHDLSAICFTTILGLAAAFFGGAGQDPFNDNAPAELRQFSFWLGDWEFVNPTTLKDGTTVQVPGTNHISVVFDGYGILEDFSMGTGPQQFSGGSLTIFNRKDGKFHQSWTDNAGFVMTFVGGMEGDAMILYGPEYQQNGKTVRTRLVWKNIRTHAMDWSYERTEDGGATWVSTWDIAYTRKK